MVAQNAASDRIGWNCDRILIEFHFHTLRNTTVTYSLLLAILFFAVRWGRLETMAASGVAALGFLYYFQEPVGSLKATDPQSYVPVAGFLITAIIVSDTALKARRRAAEALERKRETERLYELGQAMLACDSLQTTVWIAIHQAIPIVGVPGAALYVPPTNEVHRAGEAGAITDDALRAAAAAKTNYVDKLAAVSIVPIKMGEELAGSLGLCGAALSETVLLYRQSGLDSVGSRARRRKADDRKACIGIAAAEYPFCRSRR